MTSDRYAGAMLGMAIGDALGFPTEFRKRAAILDSFGADGVTDLVGIRDPRWPAVPVIVGKAHPAGTVSDDTQMAMAVARALLAADELEAIMTAMAAEFVAWSRSPDNDRAPGSTCMTGCHNLARGVPWRNAGVAGSKGAGAPMRAVPIGLRYPTDRARLLEVARASSLPTHGHPAAVESAAAVALMTAMALSGAAPEEMHRQLIRDCAPGSPDLADRLDQLPAMLDQPPEVALSAAGLGESWIAEEAVVCALYCLWRHPDDFAACVLTAINTDGDSDTIGCIAGGIAGARNGLAGIPQRWVDAVEYGDELRALADGLAAAA